MPPFSNLGRGRRRGGRAQASPASSPMNSGGDGGLWGALSFSFLLQFGCLEVRMTPYRVHGSTEQVFLRTNGVSTRHGPVKVGPWKVLMYMWISTSLSDRPS